MKTNQKPLIFCLIVIYFLISLFIVPSLSAATNNLQTTNVKHIPILFISGSDYKGSYWQTMKSNFITDGWNDSSLYNPTFSAQACDLEGKASNIMTWVDYLLNSTKSNKVDIVAQGAGGIEARYYLKFLAGIDKVDTFIMLGTPNHGNTRGCYSTTNQELVKLNEGDETPGGVLADTIGNRTGLFGIEHYNGTHISEMVKYISLFSNQDSAVSIISAPLDGALNILFNNTNIYHQSFYSDSSVYTIVKTACTNYDSLVTKTIITSSIQSSSHSKSIDGFSILISGLSIYLAVLFKNKQKNKKS